MQDMEIFKYTDSKSTCIYIVSGFTVSITSGFNLYSDFIHKMSQRLAKRIPKQMLLFFNEDKSTSMLNTNKVLKILNGESKLHEGCSVEVDFDGVSYEALVLKLHGKYQYCFQLGFLFCNVSYILNVM